MERIDKGWFPFHTMFQGSLPQLQRPTSLIIELLTLRNCNGSVPGPCTRLGLSFLPSSTIFLKSRAVPACCAPSFVHFPVSIAQSAPGADVSAARRRFTYFSTQMILQFHAAAATPCTAIMLPQTQQFEAQRLAMTLFYLQKLLKKAL
jgi:hypothetical protein